MFGISESFVSTKAQIIGCAIVLAIVAGIGFVVVQSGVLNNPTIYLRNESDSTVTIILTNLGLPSPGSMPAGTDIIAVSHPLKDQLGILSVPTWTEGECPTSAFSAGMGFQPTGAGFIDPAAWLNPPTSWTVFPPGGPYYVRVDRSGVLDVGEPLPSAPAGCSIYLASWLRDEG